jgi:HD-GYP domain-containing protein (c-di-GMP phosphodiesterase class II)
LGEGYGERNDLLRLIPLNCVPNGAELGRDIASAREDGIPLLRAGTPLTTRFKDALRRAGVHSVYVSDEATRGINPRPVLSDATRAAATAAVASTFEIVREALVSGEMLTGDMLDTANSAAARMAHEVGSEGDVALALADLSGADSYTLQHSIDVAALGILIGQRLYRERGYIDYRGQRSFEKVERRLTALALGLLLQDIGKLAVPRELLDKRGPLNDREWSVMRMHPVTGANLLRSDTVSLLVKATVRSHHERWDGGGYPDGKFEEEIHEHARIGAVADAYDAVTSERVFAPAKPAHVGVRVVREGRGTLFDPEIVDAFSKIVAPYPPGDAIELSDGRGGVVASVPEEDLDRPVVRVLGDGDPYELPLLDHPALRIIGWEDMDPAPARVQRWAI